MSEIKTHDRSKFFSSTDIPALLGISRYRTAVDLWLDKVDPKPPPAETPPMRRGKRLEPYVLEMIREEHGIDPLARNRRYTDPGVPYFTAEVDAEAADADGVIYNLELKSAFFGFSNWGASGSDDVPLAYAAQVQWALGVTGRHRALLFALVGDDLRRYDVAYDEEIVVAMRTRAREFWERYVIPKVRPPLEHDNPLTLETLKRLYHGTDGSQKAASEDVERWYAVMQDAQIRARRYETMAEAAKAHMLDEMGSAALLTFQDGKALRRKEVKRAGYTVEPATYMDARFINVKEK